MAGADTLPGMSFTPDPSELVVSYGGRIWRVPLSEDTDAVPSPDGQTLAFAALDRLYVRPIPDGEPRRLTALDLPAHDGRPGPHLPVSP